MDLQPVQRAVVDTEQSRPLGAGPHLLDDRQTGRLISCAAPALYRPRPAYPADRNGQHHSELRQVGAAVVVIAELEQAAGSDPIPRTWW